MFLDVTHVSELGVVRREEEPDAREALLVVFKQIFAVIVDRVEQSVVAVELLIVFSETNCRVGRLVVLGGVSG